MRTILGGLLVVNATAVAAGPAEDTYSGALTDGVAGEQLAPVDLTYGWRLDATLAQRASAIRGSTDAASSAAIGGELAVSHADCDVVVAGGQLDGTLGADAPLAAQQWASLCPLSGEMTLLIDHLLEWDVRPRLLARPRLRPEASRRETFSVSIGSRLQLLDPDASMTFVETTMGFSMGWTADAMIVPDATVTASSAFVGYYRERADDVPLDVDFLGVEMLGTPAAQDGDRDPDNDGMVLASRLDLVRWSGARWRGLRIGGRLGFAVIGADVGVRPPHRETIVTVTEPALSIERDLDDELTVRASAERSHGALWDGLALIDDRATLAFVRHTGRFRIELEGFAARSYLVDGDDRITRVGTGGVTALAEVDLGAHAVARLRSDLGRGFYAAGATLAEPRWAAEVLATVDLRAGNR